MLSIVHCCCAIDANVMSSTSKVEVALVAKKKKTHLILLFLCTAFGLLGAHRFYKRKYVTGTFMLLTLGGVGIWYLIDLYMILMGKSPEKKKKKKVKKVAYS